MSFKINKDSMKFKIAAFVVFLVFMAAVTIAMIPMIKLLRTPVGRHRLEAFIRSYKTFGILIFLFIQALQVVIALIPPIQLLGGVLFGGLGGGILSILGVWLGTAAVFGLVRLFGTPLVEAIVDKKNIKKFKFFEDEERLEHILFILFLIPGTPKDSLAYLVPLTKIDFKSFMLYVMPARIPAIILTTFLGSSIRGGHKITAAILAGVFVSLAVLGLIFRDKVIDWLKRLKEERRRRKSEK